MKTMKWLSTIVLSLSANFATAEFLPIKEIGSFGDWKVLEAQDHPIWHKDACMAMTVLKEKNAQVATLELYAEKEPAATAVEGSEAPASVFNDPTIQVTTIAGFPSYVRAILTDGRTPASFNLMLASNTENPPTMGLIARADERKAVTDLLKRANTAKVQFINDKNVVVKNLAFSLKGSTKALESAVTNCRLTLE